MTDTITVFKGCLLYTSWYIYIDIFQIVDTGTANLYFLYSIFKNFSFRHKM